MSATFDDLKVLKSAEVIAESFGRYNFGEKLQFLYYSRGSLFETKYWLNRTSVRELMNSNDVLKYVAELTSLARQLNTFASGLKTVRAEQPRRIFWRSIFGRRPIWLNK